MMLLWMMVTIVILYLHFGSCSGFIKDRNFLIIANNKFPNLEQQQPQLEASNFIAESLRHKKRRRQNQQFHIMSAVGGEAAGDSTSSSSLPLYDQSLIDLASIKLDWEIIKDKNERPTLNLSSRDQSPEDVQNIENSSCVVLDSSDWDDGQQWKKTIKGLKELGIFDESDDDKTVETLTACPQLLRLDTEMILETAKWLLDNGFKSEYILSEPRLLSYPPKEVEYGIEFMSIMMMTPKELTKTTILASSQLFIAGIDGGIQEQSVKFALGKASDATRDANQRIAGDMMSSLNQLKNANRKGL